MVSPRIISKSSPDTRPFSAWNAMVNICALEPLEDCTPAQRQAALVFWYDAEVGNGGHFQYFVNSAGAHRDEAIGALQHLGAHKAAEILRRAIDLIGGVPPEFPESAEEFITEAQDSGLSSLDIEFNERAAPEISDALERYLQANEHEFVQWVP